METWQIRERGTNKVLKEFEAVAVYIDGSGSFCVVQENGAKDPDVEGFKFNLILHYICRKGEMLVSEDEYNALKAEIAELKAQKEPASEPEKEVEQVYEFYKGKIKALNDLHAKMNELVLKSSQGCAIAYAAPIAVLAMQIAQVSAEKFNQGV